MSTYRIVSAIVCFLVLPASGAPSEDAPAPACKAIAEVVQRIEPRWPHTTMGMTLVSGWVTVEGTIGVDGKVIEVRVVEAQPQKVFNSTALRAVKKWTFNRCTPDGSPPRKFMQTIRFQLDRP